MTDLKSYFPEQKSTTLNADGLNDPNIQSLGSCETDKFYYSTQFEAYFTINNWLNV